MSETHVNAYALELQEKRQQRSVLDGEIATLEKVVKSMTPEEEAEPKKKASPKKVVKEPSVVKTPVNKVSTPTFGLGTDKR